MSIPEPVRALVATQYADTHRRLKGWPEYEKLKAAAAREEFEGSKTYLARNRFAFYIETRTPLPEPVRAIDAPSNAPTLPRMTRPVDYWKHTAQVAGAVALFALGMAYTVVGR